MGRKKILSFQTCRFPKISVASVFSVVVMFFLLVIPDYGAAKEWKIFVAPSAHTDIGYNYIQTKVPEIHNQNVDLAMELFEEYPRFKWNLEVAWQAENYLRDRPEERDKFIGYLREGMLGMGALYLNMLTGLCSSEELNRLCYYAGELKRRYGVKTEFALLSDVPTAVATLPSVLAGSGIKYFAHAINQDRAPVYWYRDYPDSPYWWEGPDGAKVLVWNTPHRYINEWRLTGYAQAGNLGMQANCATLARNLEKFLGEFEEAQYPYDAALVYGAVSDNANFSEKLPRVVSEWNEDPEHPRMIFCTNDEFFSYVEENFRDKIPILSGDEGAYWEDGAGSSAKETAINRQTHEEVVSAEEIWSILGWLDPDIKYPKAQFDSCWKNIFLYDEHTWGANSSILLPEATRTKEQWEIKSSYVYRARKIVRGLLSAGMGKFASFIQTKENPVIFVFNPLSWPRGDIVRVALPGRKKFIIVDSTTGEEVPYQQDKEGAVRFLARGVPPVGYKIYKVIEGQEQLRQVGGTRFFGNGIENKFYRIELDPRTGGIESIRDKELGSEFVDKESNYKFNQYLYVTGGRATRAVRPEKDLPLPDFELHNPTEVKISPGENGPVFGELLVESAARLTPRIKQKIILYNDLKRIDLINEFEKEETYEKEAVYFPFPFNFRNPRVRIEIPDGVMRPGPPRVGNQLKGACLDWHCVQQWLSICDDKQGVIWASRDSPLVCLGDLNPGKWLGTLNIDNGTIFAYVMNNYWYTNYKAAQGGGRFRYALTTHSGESADLKSIHFGDGVANEFLTRVISPQQAGEVTGGVGSFCKIDTPAVIILAIKQAEDGQGWIIRLLETAGQSTKVSVVLPFLRPTQAWLCNLVEENMQVLSIDTPPLAGDNSLVSVPVKKNGVVTVRVKN